MAQEHEFITLYKKLMMNKIDIEVLLEWLGSQTSDSWLVVHEFGIRKDEKIVNALIESFGGDYSWIKDAEINPTTVSIFYTLGLIGDKRAVDMLLEIFVHLISKDMDDYKWIIAWALGEIGDMRALQPLQKALKKDNFAEYWSIGDGMSSEWQSWLLTNDLMHEQERTRFDKGPVKSMPDEFLDEIELEYLSYVQEGRSDFVNEMVSPIEKAINKILSANKGIITDINAKTAGKAPVKKDAKKGNSKMPGKKLVRKTPEKKAVNNNTVKKSSVKKSVKKGKVKKTVDKRK